MREIRARAAVLLGAVLAAAAVAAPARAGDTIRVNGSGATLELMTLLNAAYLERHPEVRISMERPLGSSGAIKALLSGALDLAVSSKRLNEEQLAKGAVEREYGVTPLVIVTEQSVGRTGITTEELERIYAGEMRAWPGGGQIRVVLRPESDIDTAILRGLSPGMDRAIDAARAMPGMVVAVTDPESNEAVQRMPGAIGASALCSLLVVKPGVTALALDGVTASAATLRDGTYPLAKEMRFVTTASPPQAVVDFLAFLYSPEGRALAEKGGLWVTAGASAGR